MKKLVVGLCTVNTRKISYLEQTLRSLFQNMTPIGRESILIRVYNSDFKGIEVPIYRGFEKEINDGILSFMRIDNHPEFIPKEYNFNDDEERIKWRMKQCWDFGRAFEESYNIAPHYMHIEDDIIACKGWDMKVFEEIQKMPSNCCSIHICQGGFVGFIFHNQDLLKLSTLFKGFSDEMPADWLINFFIQLKIFTGKQPIQTNYSIFQHMGEERTLRIKGEDIQLVKFSNFIGG